MDIETDDLWWQRKKPARGAWLFRGALYGIVAAMMVGGTLLALAEQPKGKGGAKPYVCTKAQAEAGECLPVVGQKAVVTPQGGISFGESTTPTPAQHRKRLLKWSEMNQREIDELTAALKVRTDKRPIKIVCKDPMCEDLALNLDNAFESARWKSEIVIGTPFGVPPGVTVSSKWLASLFNATTANRYGAKAEETKIADEPGEYILIGAKPR